MRYFRAIFAVLLLCHAASSADAASKAGSTGGQILELGTGARIAARGDANTAWAADVYGVYYNPAGIARTKSPEIGMVYHGLHGDIAYGFLGLTQPIRNRGAMAFTVGYLDYGRIPRTTVTSGQNNVITGDVTAQSGVYTAAFGMPLGERVDLGVAVKGISERFDRHTASAFAIDLGAIAHPPVDGLTFGVSVANIGSDLGYVRRDEELPLTARAGAGYRAEGNRWGLAADLVWTKSQTPEGKVGGEYWLWPGHFVVRGGANTASHIGRGFTAGFGIHWDRVAVDYAFLPAHDIGSTHNLSLTYTFGGSTTADQSIVETDAKEKAKSLKKEFERLGSASARIYIEPFRMKKGSDKHRFLGNAMRDIFAAYWSDRELLTDDVEEAQFVLVGEYWVDDEINDLVVRARFISGIRSIESLEWRALMTGPSMDDLWRRMTKDADEAVRKIISARPAF